MSERELAPNAGAGQILFFDAPCGTAGDMTIAALLDLGVPLGVVQECLPALGLPADVKIRAQRVHVGAIGATRFEVLQDAHQHTRHYSDIVHMIEASRLDSATQKLSLSIFARLAQAESEVHRVPIEKVHFHEVGAVDAIVDIVGAAACISYLGARVMVSPLPMGKGSVKTEHGSLPLPAPATLLCLKGVPTYPAGIAAELVTPTGAAIVATVAEGFCEWPEFAPDAVGYGKGSMELPGRSNVLRAVLGTPTRRAITAGSHVVVEANVDDLSGELAGHVLTRLMDVGALDAWASPITMKKGRPALMLSALVPAEGQAAVVHALLSESTSIGVRHHPVSRTERPRRTITVSTVYGKVPVKVSEGDFGAPQLKPEFDRCVALARAADVPVQKVLREALAAALNATGKP
jgi:uncharacterized protein (TIGR00299 family) protein